MRLSEPVGDVHTSCSPTVRMSSHTLELHIWTTPTPAKSLLSARCSARGAGRRRRLTADLTTVNTGHRASDRSVPIAMHFRPSSVQHPWPAHALRRSPDGGP